MTDSNFQKALKHVLIHEGGYADDPRDNGGPTMKGITQRVYDAYRQRKGRDKTPVRNITTKEVEDIYRTQYWDAVRGDDLPSGVDYATFDFAVHSGAGRAIKELQAAAGVRMDAHLGTVTLDEIALASHEDTIRKLQDRRRAFIRKLSSYKHFKRNWERRVNEVETTALTMVDQDSWGVADMGSSGGKATDENLKFTASMTGQGAAASGLGIVGGTIADMTERFEDLADYSDWLRMIFIVLVVVGIGITIYSVYRNRHAE
jgi:lysozyme family protein